ncbi:MAG: type II toxin-antitoxin system VapC family toxin [archaeon]|nr:type II toxin-antitoxin system VapC family toxin [archaeon]
MKKVCLDTDFLVALLRKKQEANDRAREYEEKEVIISTTSMNAFEIFFGAYRSLEAIKNLKEADELLDSLNILHLTKDSAKKSSEILSKLIKVGKPIELRDAIIAGIALNEGYTLVTRNIIHFERVTGLSLEKW